jgi:hypothetical protein
MIANAANFFRILFILEKWAAAHETERCRLVFSDRKNRNPESDTAALKA